MQAGGAAAAANVGRRRLPLQPQPQPQPQPRGFVTVSSAAEAAPAVQSLLEGSLWRYAADGGGGDSGGGGNGGGGGDSGGSDGDDGGGDSGGSDGDDGGGSAGSVCYAAMWHASADTPEQGRQLCSTIVSALDDALPEGVGGVCTADVQDNQCAAFSLPCLGSERCLLALSCALRCCSCNGSD